MGDLPGTPNLSGRQRQERQGRPEQERDRVPCCRAADLRTSEGNGCRRSSISGNKSGHDRRTTRDYLCLSPTLRGHVPHEGGIPCGVTGSRSDEGSLWARLVWREMV